MNTQENQSIHPYNLENAMHRFERDYIRNILELTNWDLEATARMLGIELDELKRKLVFYGN